MFLQIYVFIRGTKCWIDVISSYLSYWKVELFSLSVECSWQLKPCKQKKIDEEKLNPKCNIDTKLRFDLFILSKKKGSAKRHLVLRYIGLYGHKTSRDYGLFCECRPERKRLSYPINFAKFLISPFDFPCETPSFLLRFFALYSLGLTKDPISWENFTGFAEKAVS